MPRRITHPVRYTGRDGGGMTAEAIEEHLASARSCRVAGDLPGARAALARAVAAADALGDARWRSITRWRAAKAAFDAGDAPGILDALDPLLALDDPFADYPAGRAAVEPATRLVWDELGYADRRPEALWTAWTRVHRAERDPYLAAMGEIHGAWPWACRGELNRLAALLERWSAMTPRRFGGGPHRHTQAADTPSSVYWVQRDAARTVLRGATWAGAERLAWAAWDALEDAMEDTGADRSADYWFLEPVARAALRFGWEDALPYVDLWRHAATALDHPRAALHQALARAELARQAGDLALAASAFQHAATLARGAGPEWEADALVEAARCGAATDDVARAVAARYGLAVHLR